MGENPRNRDRRRAALLAVPLGVVAGGVTWAFLVAIHVEERFLWHTLGQHWAWWGSHVRLATLLTCLFGGLTVGGLRRWQQVPSGDADSFAVAEDERPPSATLIGGLLIAMAGLATGAALGPEAPLIVLVGGLASRIARVLHLDARSAVRLSVAGALGAVLGLPGGATLTADGSEDAPRDIASMLVAATCGAAALLLLPSGTGWERVDLPAVRFGASELGWALGAGAAGALAGLALARSHSTFTARARLLLPDVTIRATVAGALLGVAGMIQPLLLFSGHHESQLIVDGAGQLPSWELVAIGIAKITLVLVMLGGGYVGGEIFPAAFAGIALGSALVPLGAPVSVVAAAGAGGAIATAFGKPLVAILIAMFLLPVTAVVPICVGAAVGALIMSLWPAERAARTGAGIGLPAEEAT